MAFFHTKLGLYVFPRVVCLPQGKQPTFGNTLHKLTLPLLDQSPSGSCLFMGIGVGFWWPDALLGVVQLRIRGETLGFGNLFSSIVVEFPIPYH